MRRSSRALPPKALRLFEFTADEHHEYGKQGRRRTRIGRRCMRCGSGVPRSEDETYWGTGLCGWCHHMLKKTERE